MLNFDEIRTLLGGVAANVGPPLRDDVLRRSELAGLLPKIHLQILKAFNGLTVYHGALRLLGLRQEPFLDLDGWNSEASWRFAWDDRVDPFLILGETAWGDQYAYQKAEGGLGEAIFFLDGTLLRPRVIAPNFPSFVRDVLLLNAKTPTDTQTIAAVRRFGPIDPSKHWVYAPSLALGGTESIDHVVELPAATAMVFAGDVAAAIARAPAGGAVEGVSIVSDEHGRPRVAVNFGPAAD